MAFFLVLSLINVLFSAQEMATDEIRLLSNSSTQLQPIYLSAYVANNSLWTKDEIQTRLRKANLVLKTCNLEIQRVYFHKWTPSEPKLRTDELITPQSPYYDGMSEAARKSFKVTPIDFFYFDDYLEPFTYGGSVPLAVYPTSYIPQHIHNTAWYPYQSAQRRKTDPLDIYSEEAHELGHILLQDVHDHSGQKNIMANDSKKRSDYFTIKQCQKMMIPTQFRGEKKCVKTANKLFPVFATHYHTYHKNFYMADWCSRNTQNLSHKMRSLGYLSDKEFSIVYTFKSSGPLLLNPIASRSYNRGWKFHVFLVTQDGIVMDLDFKKEPQLLTLENYLDEMWGPDQLSEMSFQIRKPSDLADITFLEFKDSLALQKYPILSMSELIKKLPTACDLNLDQLNY